MAPGWTCTHAQALYVPAGNVSCWAREDAPVPSSAWKLPRSDFVTWTDPLLTRPVSVSLNSVRLDCEAQAFVSCQVVALPDGFQEYSRFEPPSFHGSR